MILSTQLDDRSRHGLLPNDELPSRSHRQSAQHPLHVVMAPRPVPLLGDPTPKFPIEQFRRPLVAGKVMAGDWETSPLGIRLHRQDNMTRHHFRL